MGARPEHRGKGRAKRGPTDGARGTPGFLQMGRAHPVTPLVLRFKPTTKTCHEHHVYVIMHVIECVDKFFIT